MATNATLPKAEAKMQIRLMGTDTWRDMLEIDPFMLPFENTGGGAPILTDSFNADVLGLVDMICALDDRDAEYNLVWSDSGFSVKANCPLCDDVFPLAEGFPGDELNEGVNAVCCGCYDA
jgi:hypothetical protein